MAMISPFCSYNHLFSAHVSRFGPGTRQRPRAEALAGRRELGELGEGSDRGQALVTLVTLVSFDPYISYMYYRYNDDITRRTEYDMTKTITEVWVGLEINRGYPPK